MAFISNGTTILDNGAFSVGLGSQILISEATASASASIEFTSGIDSTYDVYQFEFINMHPGTDDVITTFQASTDGGSNYNTTATTTYFSAKHDEADTSATLSYQSLLDAAQSTSFLNFQQPLGADADQSFSGSMTIFNLSSTTYVKHFISRVNGIAHNDRTNDNFVAGYFNTTSAINAIKFQMSSGNIDAGTIKMYGIKGS